MSGGKGRGRGWLKLKTQNTISLGSESPPIITNNSPPNLNAQDNAKFSDASDDYSNLISKIKQLNINDDGIKFNQKIRYILECWNQDCQNAVEVEKSFDAIHSASLIDPDMATKLVLLIASRTFLSQEVHDQNIRLMFLRKLQNNFEGCIKMQSSNPNSFRNSVQLMGEFYNKARLANGQQFSFMATPLLSYLEMLLDSVDPLDFKLFTIQLYLNGSSLKQECPEKVAEIISKIRHMLCSEKKFTKECKLWLLLALEMSSNRFSLLPADIRTFYQDELGDHAMACFQGSHGTLTVQTLPNKTLDSYHSNVNVLQVSTDSCADSGYQQNSCSDLNSEFQSDSSTQNLSGNKDNHSVSNNKGGKSGRPILGIGARLHRNRIPSNETSTIEFNFQTSKSQNDVLSNSNQQASNNMDAGNRNKNQSGNDANWRERESKKMGNNQGNQKKDWEKKKTIPKNLPKKGWEHDDRFDTDYS